MAAQTLELAEGCPVGAWEEGESSPSSDSTEFDLAVSREFHAKCFCGELSAARELFMAIEAELAHNAEVVLALAQAEIVGYHPLQVYLHEFEPEGLGIAHFCFNYHWDGPLQALEDALRAKLPQAFAKLPCSYESPDYFGTNDWYCSENFIASTSFEMAVAAWNHCIDQAALRERLTNSGSLAHRDPTGAAFLALLARVEAAELGKAAGPGAAAPKALRV